MITKIRSQSFESSRVLINIYLVVVIALFLLNSPILLSRESPVSLKDNLYKQTRIAFTSTRDGNFEIYAMNTDGTNQIRLTNNPAFDAFPSWNPGGRKITFARHIDGNPDIFLMNADGSKQTRLTNNPAYDNCPSWSSDGKRIFFLSNRDENLEIYVMNTDGTNQINLTNNPAYDGFPPWGPR